MQNTIDNIYNKFVEIEETIQALAITTGIFKEHFDRDSEKGRGFSGKMSAQLCCIPFPTKIPAARDFSRDRQIVHIHTAGSGLWWTIPHFLSPADRRGTGNPDQPDSGAVRPLRELDRWPDRRRENRRSAGAAG